MKKYTDDDYGDYMAMILVKRDLDPRLSDAEYDFYIANKDK